MKLPEKVFVERRSLLTELLEGHFKTLRNLFFAMLFGFLVNDFVNVLLNRARASFGFELIQTAFGKFYWVILLWILMFMVNVQTYTLFKLWANLRSDLPKNEFKRKLYDNLGFAILITYYFGTLYLVPPVIFSLDLPIISSCIVTMEQIRLLMKSHSFLRSNVPKILNFKPHDDKTLDIPTLSKYIYFSFAPTLVYRDEYPRSKHVDWSNAAMHFVEFIVCIWLQSFVFEKFFIDKFFSIGKDKINWRDTLLDIFENVLPGVFILVANFYLVLHNWQNGFAEILRFADRRFYEDWWTSTHFSRYFRTWNVVVHDWLYMYIYKDMYEIMTTNNKALSKFMVFLISAVIHEYVLYVMLRMFFPLSFIQFMLGCLLTVVSPKHPVYNVLFLYALGLGFSILLSVYTIEYVVRTNYPVDDQNISSCFIPKIVTLYL